MYSSSHLDRCLGKTRQTRHSPAAHRQSHTPREPHILPARNTPPAARTMKFDISEVTSPVGDERAVALAKPISHLSSAPPPTQAELEAVVQSEAAVLLIAEVSGTSDDASDQGATTLAGCLTLIMFRIPTGLRARIEDVVVDQPYRGLGLGRALNEAALERAKAAGARSVDLTSSPRREAANQLYAALGFEKRDTNVYRYSW